MKKYYKYILLGLVSLFSHLCFISAENFKCTVDKYEVEYNSSGEIVAVYKDGEKDPAYNGNVKYNSVISPKSASECPNVDGLSVFAGYNPESGYYFDVSYDYPEEEQSASSCAEFHNEQSCNSGVSSTGKYGCAWNKKYNFCSPNGLAYLSCGSGNSDAHDIPVFLPRITSYAIAILKTVTPVILIIMSMVQIIKAIASQNEDEMKKARSALVKKLIAATLIFFVTTIVQFVIKKAADDDEVGSASQCLSCFVNNDCNGSMYYVDGYGNCYYLSSKYTATDCKTDIGVKPRGWVEAADDSSSDDSSGGSAHGGGDLGGDSLNNSSSGGSSHGGGAVK